MKTKVEIIKEIADYYSEDVSRRCFIVNEDGELDCMYYHQGKVCAVGYCMIKPESFSTFKGDVYDLALNGDHLDTLLKEEYRGHSIRFWTHLQTFHDMSSNWNRKGLTEKGKEQLNYLLTKFIN